MPLQLKWIDCHLNCPQLMALRYTLFPPVGTYATAKGKPAQSILGPLYHPLEKEDAGAEAQEM